MGKHIALPEELTSSSDTEPELPTPAWDPKPPPRPAPVTEVVHKTRGMVPMAPRTPTPPADEATQAELARARALLNEPDLEGSSRLSIAHWLHHNQDWVLDDFPENWTHQQLKEWIVSNELANIFDVVEEHQFTGADMLALRASDIERLRVTPEVGQQVAARGGEKRIK